LEIIGYLILVISGITLALIGGGGSLLSTPVMIYFFHMDAAQSTTYSLFAVAIGSGFGAFTYIKKGFVDLKLAFEFALPCFLSIFLVRSYGITSIPESFEFIGLKWTRDISIMLPFAIVMGISALKSLQRKKIQEPIKTPSKWMATIQGFLVGALTGFVGVGGGFLITPILHFVMGLDFKKAVGTSLFVLTLNSTFGFAVDLSRGAQVSYSLLLMLASTSIIGLIIGFSVSNRIKEEKIKTVFSYTLAIVALSIFIDYARLFTLLNF
jgi:uncharacterized protein